MLACGLGLINVLASGTSLCGNGVKSGNEQCDDGNVFDGDGCSQSCRYEDPCGCQSGSVFICADQASVMQGLYTYCCRALVNPVTRNRVCHCRGQSAPTPWSSVSVSCVDEDVDECRVNNGGCAANALCVNLDGRSFPNATSLDRVLNLTAGRRCVCPAGLYGDGESRCSTQQLGVSFVLGIRNLTSFGNVLQPSWVEQVALEFALNQSWFSASEVLDVTASYLPPATEGGGGQRRLFQLEYDHLLVVFVVSDWTALQRVVDSVNSELVASFIQGQTGGLNQILVLQSTSSLVEDSPSAFTDSVSDAPGFAIDDISYDEGLTSGGVAHFWDLSGQFFSPPGMFYVLFATDENAGASPLTHECSVSPDVCCLHRMSSSYHMGAFSTVISERVSPWCTGVGGTLNATGLLKPATEILRLSDLSNTGIDTGVDNGTTGWIQSLFASGFDRSNVSASVTRQGTGDQVSAWGTVKLYVSQVDVADSLSHARKLDNTTTYTFSIGMLFFRPLPVPRMVTAVAQSQFQVITSAEIVATASTNQDYTFLEFLDVSLYEIEYRPSAGVLSRLQFARVVFVLPPEMWAPADGAVPPTSLQVAFGTSVTALQDSSLWINPCLSADNVTKRDGSGLWDFNNGTRAVFQLASEAACAAHTASFCEARNDTVEQTGDATLFSIDVPLGEDALSPELMSIDGPPYYVFLRMIVRGLKETPNSGVIEALSQVSTQLLVNRDRFMRLCANPVLSVLKDTDFVALSVSVGKELAPTTGSNRDEVVFDDITRSVAYAETNVLDTGDAYKAVSIIDSMLTVVLQGSDNFFTLGENWAYSVELDSVVVVHVRDTAKHAELLTHVNSGNAFTEEVSSDGFNRIVITDDFLRVCYDGLLAPDPFPDSSLDCVIEYAIVDRTVTGDLAHGVSSDVDSDLTWLLILFGNSPYMREVALAFALRTRERFSVNYRYRKAWWVVPTYSWPASPSIGLTDQTILFTSFAVDRGV
jgi:cysteine-rich repeat protein